MQNDEKEEVMTKREEIGPLGLALPMSDR